MFSSFLVSSSLFFLFSSCFSINFIFNFVEVEVNVDVGKLMAVGSFFGEGTGSLIF